MSLEPEVILMLIPFLLLLLLLTVGLLLWYSGIFIPPNVKTIKPPFQELEVAYKFVRGSHKDCSLVYAEAHSLVPQLKCIGVYYDNPREISVMRSIVGLILNDEKRVVTDEEKQKLQIKGFQITTFPAVEHVVYADFPHKSFLSVLVAVHKIVPSFRAYVEENKLQAYPLIEICDGSKIVYVAPLSKQSDFFVYEAMAESEEEITSEKTMDEEVSSKEAEELLDSISELDSLEGGSKVEDLPSNEEILYPPVKETSKVKELPSNDEILDSLEEKNKASNGSEASTESFEELQLDS